MKTSFDNLSSIIWNAPDDVLRGLFKPHEYGRIILPFAVLRRLDCVIEKKKDEVISLHNQYKNKIDDLSSLITKKIKLPFYNFSKFDLSRIKSDPQNTLINFENYKNSFSNNVSQIIKYFEIDPLIQKINREGRLHLLISKFTEIDLHPKVIDNHKMGSIYEELLRKFSEMTNEESGDHFTPRDIVNLIVKLLFEGDKENLKGDNKIRSIYDPCCGTGGMLTIGKERILTKINSKIKIDLFGQELNDISYAICKSDLLMLNENVENIQGPNSTLSKDKFKNRKFDYLISNPPFGQSWKSDREFIKAEYENGNGRFVKGLPRVSDGTLLFFQHLIDKMNDDGAKIAAISNGSALFTGEEGSGESEIRKWMIEKDIIEAIIRLPNEIFFNTPLTTYIWIMNNKKKKSRKNLIQLIDSVEYFEKLRKPLGLKNKIINENHIDEIYNLYSSYKDTDNSKILRSSNFLYRSIKIETDEDKFNEKIPFEFNEKEYFKNNLKKFPKNSRINLDETVIGSEFIFNKFFYNFEKYIPKTQILKNIKSIEKKITDIINYE